jgi:ribosomal protein L29
MIDFKFYTTEELRKMNEEDLMALLRESEKELARFAISVRTGKDKQSHRIDLFRKQIARINTINSSKINSSKNAN